jgi:hypothetical protein
MVGRIKEVLDTDVTNDDSVGKLEDFKKSANAYGECTSNQIFAAAEPVHSFPICIMLASCLRFMCTHAVADYRRLVSPGQKSFAEVYGGHLTHHRD